MHQIHQKKILITRIQRFSLHDGPGIRTTVFLKGCSIHCPWCCNPENISPYIEPFFRDGIESHWGVWYSQDELYDEIIRDKSFYIGEIKRKDYNINNIDQLSQLPGGVTFSGGEALLQISSYFDVLNRLGEDGIHKTIETSLYVPKRQMEMALEVFDLFYADLKILNRCKCQDVLGGDLDTYLKNLDYLLNSGKPIIIRIPIIGDYTDNDDNLLRMVKLLSKYNQKKILQVEILKGHHLGDQKYIDLGKNVPLFKDVSMNDLERIRSIIKESKLPVVVQNIVSVQKCDRVI